MAQSLNMPKLGMDMEEGTILRWLKKEGDAVQEGEVVAEIETDKASMELEAPASGTLLKIYHQESETVPVNTLIAAIGAPGEELPEQAPAAASRENAASCAVDTPVELEREPQSSIADGIKPEQRRVRISPRARKLAEYLHLDVTTITGTGPSGRIVERDVRNRANTAVSAPKRVRSETILPLTGIRRIIAERMHKSLSEMAQANHRMWADMSNMTALRKQLNQASQFAEQKISFLDLMIAACSRALTDCPFANVSLESDGIHQKNYVNIGVAVETDRGLVVPVIHDADQMTVAQISGANREMIEKARAGSLKPDDMSGGTFTISNLGMFGVDSFTAIVNPPESCILAVGRIADQVVARNGTPVVLPMMNLSLTYDHRILDGAPAARLLQRIQFYMENPALLLL